MIQGLKILDFPIITMDYKKKLFIISVHCSQLLSFDSEYTEDVFTRTELHK